MRPKRLLGLLLAVVLLAVQPAMGFGTFPPGASPHDQITSDAAGPLGFTGSGLLALQQAVRRPDLDETTFKVSGERLVALDASASYQPSHHCDRAPPNSAGEAFAATADYVRTQREEARQFAVAGQPERAVRALGNALHALQDCHSHSDIVDHDETTRKAFERALLDDLALPAGIRICGFQPGAKVAEMPDGDTYPHGLYNKDGANSTDDAATMLPTGQTKYFAAKGMATTASSEFLAAFLQTLTVEQRNAVFAVTPTSLLQGGHLIPLPAVALPGVLMAGIVGFLVSAIWFAPPVFGKSWSRLLGKTPEESAKWHWKNIILTFVAALLTAYLLDFFVHFAGATDWLAGAQIGLIAWLAFVALQGLPRAALERAPMRYILDMGHTLLALAAMGAILANWG